MDNIKPTFGTGANSQTENKKFRPEIGAIWEREASNLDKSKYLSIKLTLTKEILKELYEGMGDNVSLNLVAFTNKSKGDSEKRPSFRIFQELPRK